jgi:ABC-type transport system involved in multi-copper enzyme maturation permease subunit
MSVQTGVETPQGPASRRIGDRMKFRVSIWQTQPNPIWIREMRQSARLLRTPIILMVLTVLMALFMTSIGGLITGSTSPAKAGLGLFHTYFSLAFFVVTLIGPALAANSIASEREGKTWEALLLTGMRPSEVARGKFLSAYTSIAMYVVMLAPVGAIPFLFGGVAPIEVLVAFLFLFLIALLSVAFGLAVSSKMQSLRSALLVTLLVAVMLSLFSFSTFGFGFSFVAHEIWEGVEEGMPVWLPTAYSRAPFGLEYVVYLICLPTAAVVLPAWLLFEVTRANLTSVTDDRSYGLKKWFLVTSVVLTAVAAIPMIALDERHRASGMMAGMACYGVFIVFSAFLFGGEAIGPSRRVNKLLATAGRFRRMLAPGVSIAGRMQLIAGAIAVALLGIVCFVIVKSEAAGNADEQIASIILFTSYTLGFSCFVIGLSALLRSRSTSTTVPRVLLMVILFFVLTGPWILAAITGVMASSSSKFGIEMAVAAPSPFYVLLALDAASSTIPGVAVLASMVAAVSYGGLGFLLMFFAHRRCNAVIAEHEEVLGEADRRLAEEDAEAEAAETAEQADALEELAQPELAQPELAQPAPADAAATMGEPVHGTTSDEEQPPP